MLWTHLTDNLTDIADVHNIFKWNISSSVLIDSTYYWHEEEITLTYFTHWSQNFPIFTHVLKNE